MPQKLNRAGEMQNYIPAGNGEASGEYGDTAGNNKNFKSFHKKKELKTYWKKIGATSSVGVSRHEYEKLKSQGKEVKEEPFMRDLTDPQRELVEKSFDEIKTKLDMDKVKTFTQLEQVFQNQIKKNFQKEGLYTGLGVGDISEPAVYSYYEELREMWKEKADKMKNLYENITPEQCIERFNNHIDNQPMLNDTQKEFYKNAFSGIDDEAKKDISFMIDNKVLSFSVDQKKSENKFLDTCFTGPFINFRNIDKYDEKTNGKTAKGVLTHECFHGIDRKFSSLLENDQKRIGTSNSELSVSFITSTGKTLFETLKNETRTEEMKSGLILSLRREYGDEKQKIVDDLNQEVFQKFNITNEQYKSMKDEYNERMWEIHDLYPNFDQWKNSPELKQLQVDMKEYIDINKEIKGHLDVAEIKLAEKYAGLSDMVNGMTKGQETINGFCHKTSYWKDTENRAIEFFAEYFEAMHGNKAGGLEIMRKHLPKTCKCADEIIDYVRKHRMEVLD